MSVTIRILKGEGHDKPHDLVLDKTTILIGRGSGQDVQFRNDSVSRRHAVIEQRDGRWFVIDEGSRNGVVLNGTRVKDRERLAHGDVIELGEVMFLAGLDKPLDESSVKAAKPADIGLVTRLIRIGFLLVGLAVLVFVCFFLYGAQSYVASMTRPVTLDFSQEKTLDVFDEADRRNLTFALPANLPRFREMGRWYPVPEWNTRDVWDTALEGRQPRLFDGLDLSLNGGELVCLSSYFYVSRVGYMQDANDPYGRIHFDLEGWAGLGPRLGSDEIPLIRNPELPRYLQSVHLYPENIRPWDGPFEGGQVASFSYTDRLYPADNPLGYPKYRQWLAGKILPPLASKEVTFEGRIYSFFHDGARYTAIVRGSTSLLRRLGGIDKVAGDYIATIRFPETDDTRKMEVDREALAGQARDELVFMANFDNKRRVLDDLLYEDLLRIRDLIKRLQALERPLPVESELRRAYFELRNRAQDELEYAMQLAYESRGRREADEALTQLRLMRAFLGKYPLPTMQPGQFGYPEWARFYQEAVQEEPFDDI